jgi:hypothetical protein
MVAARGVQSGQLEGHRRASGPAGGHPTRRFVLDPLVDTDTTLDSSTVSGVVSTSTVSTGANLSDEQEERAAIRECDGGLNREEADRRAFAETLDRDKSRRSA